MVNLLLFCALPTKNILENAWGKTQRTAIKKRDEGTIDRGMVSPFG